MPASARKISANSAITISVRVSSSVSAGNGAWKPASNRVCSRAVLISESKPATRIRSAPTSAGSANSEVTRVLLIANPMAARTAHASVGAVANALRVGGWDVEVLATGGPGHARELAEYGVANGVNVVAVFGGDGTTMQAAAALVGTDVPLGVIPGGTGNLLAGNLRIPPSPARAARALLTALPHPLDLGRMERPGGYQYFAVACGAGYDARVMAATLSQHKRRWGMGAYVATSLRLIASIQSSLHVITIDGVRYEVHAAMVLVANCGEVIPRVVRLPPPTTPPPRFLFVFVVSART